MPKISVDHPGHVDQLGRTAFARHLLAVIEKVDLSYSGVVIGLEGTWGSGKTRVLNSIPDLLEEQSAIQRPCLVRFNPWMVSGTNGLVEALLLQMSAGLATSLPPSKVIWRRVADRFAGGTGASKGAAIASSLIEYAGVLGAVKHFAAGADFLLPGAGLVVAAIGNAADSAEAAASQLKGPLKKLAKRPAPLSIPQAKARVDALLRDFGRPLIVVVDDLDRLPPMELASMVQAIKAVADFPNVAYVLAYDPVVAAHGLEEGLKVEDGSHFLEKVVQVRLPLPEIPARRIMTFGMARLQQAIDDTSQLDPLEQEDLSNAWLLAAALMETPRDIERLRTRLLVTVPVLRGAVNLADVVLLEAIELKAAAVLNFVQSHPGALLVAGADRYDEFLHRRGTVVGDSRERQAAPADRNAPPEWEASAANVPQLLTPLRNAMAFVFKSESWDRSRNATSPHRAQDFRFWYRWRCYHDHHDTWDVKEVAAFIRDPRSLLKAGIHARPAEFQDVCQLIWSLGRRNFREADSQQFVEFVREASAALGREQVDGAQTLGVPLRALEIALATDKIERREKALVELVETCPLWLSGRLLLRLRGQIRKHAETGVPAADELVYVDDAQQERHSSRWRDLARSSLTVSGQSAFTHDDLSPYYVLLWMLFLDETQDSVRALADRMLLGEATDIETFFGDFCQGEEGHVQLNEVPWDCLPAATQLIEMGKRSAAFSTNHGYLLRLFIARSEQEIGAKLAATATVDPGDDQHVNEPGLDA